MTHITELLAACCFVIGASAMYGLVLFVIVTLLAF
jgi:hypothetical protein